MVIRHLTVLGEGGRGEGGGWDPWSSDISLCSVRGGGGRVGPMVIRHLTVLGEGGRGEGGTHGHQTSHCAR